MRIYAFILLFLSFGLVAKAQSIYVQLATTKGNITLILYNETPKHKDMFLEAIRSGLYADAQFNRVIKSFVSQGGELDDTILKREQEHPEKPVQRLAAEISPKLFHKKGVLGAGRNDNPEKSSYFTQIYLVVGKQQTEEQLVALEKKKGIKFSASQREIYKTIGGTPHLDNDYTVFGEIVEGMDVADTINAVKTDKNDLPLEPVTFKAIVLSEAQATRFKNKTITH